MRIRTGGDITIGMSHSPRDRMENEKNDNKDSRRHTIGMYVPLTQRHNRRMRRMRIRTGGDLQ
jgi:hypothetical protein